MAKKQNPESVSEETVNASNTSKPSGSKVTPVTKLTIKTVCGKPKVADIPPLDAAGRPTEKLIARFAGTAAGTDTGESNFGVWRALKGSFAATNSLTGEVFVSKTVFIPGAMGDALYDALESRQKEDAAASVKFVVDISLRAQEKDIEKYEYVVRPVMESDVGNEAMELLSYQG